MIKISKLIFVLVLAASFTSAAFGATYMVTKTADTADGTCDADCSLREAIAAANATADNDVIAFSALFASPQTITLGGSDLIIANNGSLTITGPGSDKLIVSGNNASRVFTNNTGSIATISSLSVTGGIGVSTVQTGRGGGVYNNAGTLTLIDLAIFGNTATNGGGANNAGTATLNIVGCAIFGNAATGSGGAVQNFSGNNLNISNSSITGNTAGSTVGGGALQGNGTVTITNSTVANNNATNGPGGGIIFNGTALTVTNSTFSGNSSTTNGGGIHKSTTNPGNIRNTIVSGNNGAAASPDITGIFNSLGNNVIGNIGTATGWIGSDLQNVNPLLSPLGFYGGIGASYALLSTSPALNAGQNCVIDLSCATNNPTNAITTDQRGAVRPSNTTVEIGAFEESTAYRSVLREAVQGTIFNRIIAPVAGTAIYALASGTLPGNVTVSTTSGVASIGGTPTSSGTFDFTVSVSNGGNVALINYRLVVLPQSGSVATVGGRVTRADGNGIGKVRVTLVDAGGNPRTTITSSFGYYAFAGAIVGESQQLIVASKLYTFSPNTLNFVVTGDLNNLNFTAQP